jgi:hypothetical protein
MDPCARIEAAVSEAHVAADFVHVRTLAADVDRATRRVLAEQRALRTAQDFDAFDVEGIEQLSLHAGQHEVVHGHADRRVLVDDDVREADAAHRERRGVECGDARGREARHGRRNARDVTRRLVMPARVAVTSTSSRPPAASCAMAAGAAAAASTAETMRASGVVRERNTVM